MGVDYKIKSIDNYGKGWYAVNKYGRKLRYIGPNSLKRDEAIKKAQEMGIQI